MIIEKKDAVEAALRFIHAGKAEFVRREWAGHGTAGFNISQADYERLEKVLLVGMGELSK